MNIFEVARPGDRVYHGDHEEWTPKQKRYVSACGKYLVDKTGYIANEFSKVAYKEDGTHNRRERLNIVKIKRDKKVIWEKC